ncbi:MAG: amino acid permease [Tissierellia bacterium]|nr:amino acid permease [Tissierellia bacterium]
MDTSKTLCQVMDSSEPMDIGKPSEEGAGDLDLIRLIAFSIGTTLASGIFSISGDMAANGAYAVATIIGWLIAGIGMFGLTLCYYGLNRVRPDLTSGIYTYAKEGFGEYLGFNSAWGYWVGCLLTNVSFAALLFSAVGYFFPIFGTGNNLISVICASLIIWVSAFLILRGVRQAASLNVAIVIAKILPILAMLLSIVFFRAFDLEIFINNLWGKESGISLLDQIKATTPVTMWCFVGIESVVVISKRAKRSKDAGSATVISFLSLLLIYIMISVLSMGVMPVEELAQLGNPPMSGVMEHVLGSFGAILVNVAVIISLLGAMYTYTIFTAPIGERLLNSFGDEVEYVDLGIRKRAIVAMGNQDVGDCFKIYPRDPYIRVMGGSSDHIILDIHDSPIDYKVGDIVEFDIEYQPMLFTSLSDYVHKSFIP